MPVLKFFQCNTRQVDSISVTLTRWTAISISYRVCIKSTFYLIVAYILYELCFCDVFRPIRNVATKIATLPKYH